MNLQDLGPFDSVLDVGGNVGDFAAQACQLWPQARIVSFEPLPEAAERNRLRADGRWLVEEVALSNERGFATLNVCLNQDSASSLQPSGPVRGSLGIADRHAPLEVETALLDDYLIEFEGRCLLKVDVEGHEAKVLAGGLKVLGLVAAAVVEVQNDPGIFLGSPAPGQVDWQLRQRGLFFAGLVGVFCDHFGRVLQFDGLWLRDGEPGD